VSNFEPPSPGQGWGTPPPGGQPPYTPSGWGSPPGGTPPPYGGQQLPQYGQFGGAQGNWAPTPNTGQLADWGSRAGAFLIDWVMIFIPSFILDILTTATKSVVFEVLGYLWGIGMWVWFSVQVGTTGSSPGMRTVGLKCVRKSTGQTLGAGMAIARWLLHIIDSLICLIGWLFPLWDSERQTLADKVIGSVVVREPAQGFSLTPKR
jgi:uncharacterized RDD family membrane protein YckC